jgi:DNA helicase II / ATP-dependent DNA helicase PcrA
LSTIHNAKGREFGAVAVINVREGTFPFRYAEDVEGEKRLLYVAITRAKRLLMYIAEPDRWGNPVSRFLGPEGIGLV